MRPSDPTHPFHMQCTEAIGCSQKDLADILGISVRTASRWATGKGSPGLMAHHYVKLARAGYANDREFAIRCATVAGTTLVALGLEQPPVPKPSVSPAQADAVVCAAAYVHDLPARQVRAMVAAAFARARELGFTTEGVAAALEASVPSSPAGSSPSAGASGSAAGGSGSGSTS